MKLSGTFFRVKIFRLRLLTWLEAKQMLSKKNKPKTLLSLFVCMLYKAQAVRDSDPI